MNIPRSRMSPWVAFRRFLFATLAATVAISLVAVPRVSAHSQSNSMSVASGARVSGLPPGSSVTTPSGAYQLIMQLNGNLVLYQVSPWRATWSTNTLTPGAYLEISDGAVNLFANAARPLWSAAVHAVDAQLVLQEDGNLVVYSANRALFDIKGYTGNTGITYPGDADPRTWPLWVIPGGVLHYSPSGQYTLVASGGNLGVHYTGGAGAIWHTGTLPFPPSEARLQWTDGNFVILCGADFMKTPEWATMTFVPGSFLMLQDDGNLVVYSPKLRPLWDSKGYITNKAFVLL